MRILKVVLVVVAMTACSTSPTDPSPDSRKGDLSALQGDWRLVSIQGSVGPAAPVSGGTFLAGFGSDGDLFIQADCNVCSAGYSAGADGTLEVLGPVPCTLAYCSSAPLDTRFLELLQASETWVVDGTGLELASPRGRLAFERSS